MSSQERGQAIPTEEGQRARQAATKFQGAVVEVFGFKAGVGADCCGWGHPHCEGGGDVEVGIKALAERVGEVSGGLATPGTDAFAAGRDEEKPRVGHHASRSTRPGQSPKNLEFLLSPPDTSSRWCHHLFNCPVTLGPVQTQFTGIKLVRHTPMKEPGWIELELVGTERSEFIVRHRELSTKRVTATPRLP